MATKDKTLDLPIKAVASIAAAVIQKETGLWPKEPAGRQCQVKGDIYICEPGKEPGTVDIKIERDQTAYRLALDTFHSAESRKAIALQNIPACEKAVQQATKVKNKDHAAQHEARLKHWQDELERATKESEDAAKVCPQAWYDALTARAERLADLATTQEKLAAKKIEDAEELDSRSKKDAENKDKFSGMAKGCREAAQLAEQTAKKHRAKEAELLKARPDCSGAQDFIERKTVRIQIVEV